MSNGQANRGLALVLCTFLAGSVLAAEENGPFPVERVFVDVRDQQGRLLRSSPGFVLDDSTVVTSFNAIEGAARLVVRTPGFTSEAKQLIAGNHSLDLALVKTTTELPMDDSMALMDTLATGDPVYFYSPDVAGDALGKSRVTGWIDSGQGFEYLRLEPNVPKTSSPLLNSKGKIAGWLSGSGAVSVRAIYQLLGQGDGSLPLQELATNGKFWNLYRPIPSALNEEELSIAPMKQQNGPQLFPFHILVPGNWSVQSSVQSGRYLMLGMNGKSGVALAVRIVTQTTDDLMAAFEEMETRTFGGASRAELIPYSVEKTTGLRAYYEDQTEHGHSTSVFCALANRRMYVVTITYPQKYSEQLHPVVDDILASFRPY